MNNQLPYLVANIVEVLDVAPEDEDEEDGAAIDLDSQRKGKCVVLKTTTRQTIFLPVVGLVDADKLKPGDLVGGRVLSRDHGAPCGSEESHARSGGIHAPQIWSFWWSRLYHALAPMRDSMGVAEGDPTGRLMCQVVR